MEINFLNEAAKLKEIIWKGALWEPDCDVERVELRLATKGIKENKWKSHEGHFLFTSVAFAIFMRWAPGIVFKEESYRVHRNLYSH